MFCCSWQAVANKAQLCFPMGENVSNVSFKDTENSPITKRISHSFAIPFVVPSSYMCACSSQCELAHWFFSNAYLFSIINVNVNHFHFIPFHSQQQKVMSSVFSARLFLVKIYTVCHNQNHFLSTSGCVWFPPAHAAEGSPASRAAVCLVMLVRQLSLWWFWANFRTNVRLTQCQSG